MQSNIEKNALVFPKFLGLGDFAVLALASSRVCDELPRSIRATEKRLPIFGKMRFHQIVLQRVRFELVPTNRRISRLHDVARYRLAVIGYKFNILCHALSPYMSNAAVILSASVLSRRGSDNQCAYCFRVKSMDVCPRNCVICASV